MATDVLTRVATVPRLPLAVMRFRFTATEPGTLPAYQGAAWRGLLGHALRRVHCVTGAPHCAGCVIRQACHYAWLFETPVTETEKGLGVSDHAPHPFVLEVPPPGEPRRTRRGDRLSLGITLFGRAGAHFPALVPAVAEMGRLGLGKARGRFALETITQEPVPGSLCRDPLLVTDAPAVSVPVSVPPVPDRVRMEFLTPLRMRVAGKTMSPRTFSLRPLVAALVRRINLLVRHFDTEAAVSVAPILEAVEGVTVANQAIRWYTLKRYSNRKERQIDMDGLLGCITLSGPGLATIWPWLYLGQWTHVGKATAIGMGRYALLPIADEGRWS